MSLPRNCTISEWEKWAKSNKIRMGGEDGTIAVYIDLGHSQSGGLCMAPTVRIGSGGAMYSDSRVMRSVLRRSLAILDAIEDVYATVAHVTVWPDGECPCGSCSGRGTAYSGGPKCPVCEGRGKR